MEKKDQSLLLYIESRAVDYSGAVDSRQINGEELRRLEEWSEAGYIGFGRISQQTAQYLPNATCGYWVKLSEQAWADTSKYRQERAERAWSAKRWLTTKELNENLGEAKAD